MMLRIKLGGLWNSAARFKQIPQINTPPILQPHHRFSSATGNSSSEMGVTKEQVESSLQSKLTPSHLEVIDTSGGCGASFAVAIVSEQFEGKRLLERHRMVNAALTEEMKDIHALSITKAVTPEQWKKQQESDPRPAT